MKKAGFLSCRTAPTNFILKRRYLEGVDDVYAGDVEIGEDGITFNLVPTLTLGINKKALQYRDQLIWRKKDD